MNKKEWKIIEKHAEKFCLFTKLPKNHKFHLEPEECECVFHKMIKELKSLSTLPKAKELNNDFKAHKSSPKPCPHCNGTGRRIGKTENMIDVVKCKYCNGTGRAS